MVRSEETSEYFRPMKRLIEYTVFSGLTAACLRARLPTRRSPDLVKATTDGVVREPSALGMTTGSPPSMTAMTELVVPKSIPTVFGICRFPSRCAARREFEFRWFCLSPRRQHQNRLLRLGRRASPRDSAIQGRPPAAAPRGPQRGRRAAQRAHSAQR